MSYSKLYASCQGKSVDAHISRRDLVLEASALKGEGRVQIFETGIDTKLFRAMFFVPNCENHWSQLAKGRPCILVARELEPDWKRFVTIKELMHLFDQPLEFVGTEDDFDSLLEQLTTPLTTLKPSPGFQSENRAFYMALGVICPEVRRQGYVRGVDNGNISQDDIAKELKIPVAYVHLLLHPVFKIIIQSCIARDC